MSEWIKKLAEKYSTVNEKKKLDPVDQDELKGSHADRKDKDINNDGKVDSSDEYLHNRRKAVSKSMKKGENVEMNPKKKDSKSGSEMSESVAPVYKRILEARATAKHAGPSMDKEEGLSPSAKKMKADLENGAEWDNTDEKGHDDVEKAGRVTKPAPARPGDNKAGDKSIINAPKGMK